MEECFTLFEDLWVPANENVRSVVNMMLHEQEGVMDIFFETAEENDRIDEGLESYEYI